MGPNLASKIMAADVDPISYLPNSYSGSMFLQPVSTDEVYRAINNLNCNKSCGYDDISPRPIKAVADILCIPLTTIFNMSFENGTFPSLMKIAKVVPIFKKGDKQMVSNYRPVSLLPLFSKLLEKLFSVRLLDYIKKNDILYRGQYGFREKCSTQDAITDLVENITRAIDNNEFTIGIFIDLSKAFDTIDHQLLLRKLKYYGVRGIVNKWIKCYLSNRFQFVTNNNVNSSKEKIVCGVPQGSILGPILFLIYINDLYKVSTVMRFIIFADDTNMLLSGKNV